MTGARKFLIAYNVNLISTKEQAHRIALDIREQGRGKDQVNAGSHIGPQLAQRSLLSPPFLSPCLCGAAARPAEEGAGDWLVPGRGQHGPSVHQHFGLRADATARRLRGGPPGR